MSARKDINLIQLFNSRARLYKNSYHQLDLKLKPNHVSIFHKRLGNDRMMNQTIFLQLFLSPCFLRVLLNILQSNAVRVEKCLSLCIWHKVKDFFVQTAHVTYYNERKTKKWWLLHTFTRPLRVFIFRFDMLVDGWDICWHFVLINNRNW